eukprot:scpid106355/ scgid12579/ 
MFFFWVKLTVLVWLLFGAQQHHCPAASTAADIGCYIQHLSAHTRCVHTHASFHYADRPYTDTSSTGSETPDSVNGNEGVNPGDSSNGGEGGGGGGGGRRGGGRGGRGGRGGKRQG